MQLRLLNVYLRTFVILMPCLFLLPAYGSDLQAMTKVARDGNVEAQYLLGFKYDTGKDVDQNFVEAVKWYRLAADQGHARAQSNLGVKYTTVQGVPQNYAKAIKWTRLAAAQNYAPAQKNLGDRFAKGEGVQRDFTEAYVWFSNAVANGYKKSLQHRDTAAAHLSSHDLTQAQLKAAALYEKLDH